MMPVEIQSSIFEKHLTTAELEAGLDSILKSPVDEGTLELIVRRPRVDEREVLHEAELDLKLGLVGDGWSVRSSSRTPDGCPHPEMQLNVINSRLISLVANDKSRWPLAGDQLYVDLDLSLDNLPAGSQLQIDQAVIEISHLPHTGCHKFRARFGADAVRFVNSEWGRQHRLRGLNARIIQPGLIRTGCTIVKL